MLDDSFLKRKIHNPNKLDNNKTLINFVRIDPHPRSFLRLRILTAASLFQVENIARKTLSGQIF